MNTAAVLRFHLMLVLVALVVAGCGTSVKRVDTEKVKDLSGAWNDTDSRLVSEEMIEDVLSKPWLREYTRKNRAQPALIVGDMRNLSHEHINMNTFVADSSVREERKDQDLHATEATRNPMGQELGADFMLQGTINTIVDVSGTKQVRYYQVDMTLISLADNRKIWVGQKKIKKLVKRSKLRY
jgi:PBP1b-binding outer membrane lipoprotein LpoB